MYSLTLLLAVSLVSSLLVTPWIRNRFLRYGIVDRPDQARKLHPHPIPRVGGIAIAISYVVSYLALLASPLSAGGILEHHLPLVWKLLPAGGLIFLCGLLDDLAGLRPWQKLAAQLAASAWACAAGVRILGVVGHPIEGWWGIPLTVVWLVGCTNAFNLIDGVDGLAAGAGLFASITILIGGFLYGDVTLMIAIIPLVGALLGFLRYNFNPASIFLGDSGSLLLGFLLGCYGVIWSQKSATLLGLTAPLMALALPILDTGLAIVRRFLRRQPIFGADRGHIHHRLLDRGLTPRRVALLLYLASGIAAALSLLQSVANDQFGGLIIVLFCIVIWAGVRRLGYIEFDVAGRMVAQGVFRRMIQANLVLREFEQSLGQAATDQDCWAAVRDASRELGFARVELELDRTRWTEQLNGQSQDGWQVRIPLGALGCASLIGSIGASGHPMTLGPFLELLQRRLLGRLEELARQAASASPLPEPSPGPAESPLSRSAGVDA